MARGWESKSIESQQQDAAAGRSHPAPASPEEQDRRVRRRTLELARAKVRSDLGRATTPAHRSMLEAALASLDRQIEEA